MSTRSIVASWPAQPEGISQPPCCQRAPAAEDRKRCVTWDTGCCGPPTHVPFSVFRPLGLVEADGGNIPGLETAHGGRTLGLCTAA